MKFIHKYLLSIWILVKWLISIPHYICDKNQVVVKEGFMIERSVNQSHTTRRNRAMKNVFNKVIALGICVVIFIASLHFFAPLDLWYGDIIIIISVTSLYLSFGALVYSIYLSIKQWWRNV